MYYMCFIVLVIFATGIIIANYEDNISPLLLQVIRWMLNVQLVIGINVVKTVQLILVCVLS